MLVLDCLKVVQNKTFSYYGTEIRKAILYKEVRMTVYVEISILIIFKVGNNLSFGDMGVFGGMNSFPFSFPG